MPSLLHHYHLLLLGALLLFVCAPPCSGESLPCLAVYREGGAPAVFQSPRCPRWTLLRGASDDGGDEHRIPPPGCHVAAHQGRRRSQEDRSVCALGIRIPFLERMRIKEVDVGIIAIFDGHNGADASDMASKILLEYFLLHVYFLLDGIYSIMLRRSNEKLTYKEVNLLHEMLNLYGQEHLHDRERSSGISPAILDHSFHMEVLKESLLRTIRDVDLTFSKEALLKNLESGSTATVILIADGQVIAANVGDSKAFLCSEDFDPHSQKGKWVALNKRRRKRSSISSQGEHEDFELAHYNGPTYYVKELTKDHHPDREDEKRRVEAAGGYVLEWAGISRVNGELALSRAIGDVPYKRFGVISTPELIGWQSLSTNDSFLIAASDGVFEKMTMQDVCDLMLHEKLGVNKKLQSFSTIPDNLADYLVHVALQKGTTDNTAAVVVPLGFASISEARLKDLYHPKEAFDASVLQLPAVTYQKKSDDVVSSSIIEMEYFKHASTKFQRLVVEAKLKRLGCFYLSESLDEDMDYIFRAPEAYQEDNMHDLNHMSAEPVLSYERTLEIHKGRNFCWYFGHQNGEKGRCSSREVFAKFFGLLDSLSHNGSKSNSSHLFGYKLTDFRYKLKKRFDRGSYGEVWLAFHWNCSKDGDDPKDLSHLGSRLEKDSYNCKSSNTTSSRENCSADSRDGDLFILKRIMVERGVAAYLSGLREKYFGELFLNASSTLGDFSAAEPSRPFSVDMQFDPSDMQQKNISVSKEGLNHIARFIESFESKSKEIWLVYQNEGLSLSKLIYTAEETQLLTGDNKDEKVRHIQVLHPSKWWYWLRTTKAGHKQMQNIIWQLLMALKACHDRNITHRDIKPENMIVCFEDLETGNCLREIPTEAKLSKLNMRIIDFGSAIDDFTIKYLYGSGPTRSEQTFEYTPPEALLNASWFQGSKSARLKYDVWSVGVVMLELILGSPHVFQISDRTRVLLDQHLEGWSEHTKELAYKLRSYMELCILVPGISSQQHQSNGNLDQGNFWLASWKCSEESFSYQVKIRDPLKIGFPNVWALRLVRQLLVWHPEDRLSVDEALNHPYFQQQP